MSKRTPFSVETPDQRPRPKSAVNFPATAARRATMSNTSSAVATFNWGRISRDDRFGCLDPKHGFASHSFEKREHVGSQLVAVFVPMVVNFPIWSCRQAVVGFAPFPDRRMGFAKFFVGSNMRDGGHLAARRGGADYFAPTFERGADSHPGLDRQSLVRGEQVFIGLPVIKEDIDPQMLDLWVWF